MLWLLKSTDVAEDTWSRRARLHHDRHLDAQRTPETCDSPDRAAAERTFRFVLDHGLSQGRRFNCRGGPGDDAGSP